MPSLRLSRLIRRDPDRPTLKQRAAALRATAAKVMRRKPADSTPGPHEDDGVLPPVPRDLACGVVHGDGTVSYCDAGGAIHRETVAEWIEFTAQRLYSVAHSEMARQAADPTLVGDAWDAARDKARRELRIDALRILVGRWREAFEAAREAPHRAPDPRVVLPAGNPVLLALVEERLTALDLENGGTLSDDEGDRVHEHGARCFEKACAIRSASPADLLAKWRMVAEELRDAATALGHSPTLAFETIDADLSGPAAGALFVGHDAELLAMEARYENARDEHCAASDALDEADDAYVEPPMPDELRVRDGDWRLAGIPQTGAKPIGGGKFRSQPYGAKEVEHLRANPCMGVYVGGTEVELQPDGVSRMRPHKRAQARADAIIAAWDEWQAAIAASREAVGLPAAETAESEARERRYAILPAIRDARALTLAGLAVKARAAAHMALEDDLWATAKRFDPEQEDGLLFALAANVIDLAGSHSGAPARG